MLVGVAPLPLSFPPSGTYAFYIMNRPNCLNICNTVNVLGTYIPLTNCNLKVRLTLTKRFKPIQKKYESSQNMYHVCWMVKRKYIHNIHQNGFLFSLYTNT